MPETSLDVTKIFVKCYTSGKNVLWLSYCFGQIACAVSKFGDSSYNSVIQLLL